MKALSDFPSYKTDLGIVYFGDCLEILPLLPKSDMILTDFPYNIDAGAVKGYSSANSTRDHVETYADSMPDAQYRAFCQKTFDLMKQTATYMVFTCGFTNLGYWLPPAQKDTSYTVWINRNGNNRAYNAFFNGQEPIICYGKFPRKYQSDVFVYHKLNGFMHKSNEFIHPHPKIFELWEDLIVQMHPQSVLDPMAGSGTTAEVCEKWGINYILIELEMKYKVDIMKRIKRGQEAFQNRNMVNLGEY